MTVTWGNVVGGALRTLAGHAYRHPRLDIEQPPRRGELEETDIATFLKRASMRKQGALAHYSFSFSEPSYGKKRITGIIREPTKISGLRLANCDLNIALRENLEFKNCSFKNVRIVVDTETQDHTLLLVDGAFDHCTLLFMNAEVDGALDRKLRENAVEGVQDLLAVKLARKAQHAFGALQLTRTELSHFLIGGAMFRMGAENCEMRQGAFTGYARRIALKETELTTCRVDACVNTWSSTKTTFTDGSWTPNILNDAEMADTAFVHTFVDVSQIATRCQERASIDLRHARTDDRWERLRDSYTGAKFFMHFVFFLAFLLPLLFKVAAYLMYSGVDKATEKIGEATSQFGVEFAKSGTYVDAQVWELILYGTHKGFDQWAYGALSICLILYNAVRIVLTVAVSAVRGHEELLQSYAFNKTRPTDAKLKWMWVAHFWFMRWAVWAAVSSLLWRAYDIATTEVRVYVQ